MFREINILIFTKLCLFITQKRIAWARLKMRVIEYRMLASLAVYPEGAKRIRSEVITNWSVFRKCYPRAAAKLEKLTLKSTH